MSHEITLVGLDFGTTTSSAVVATAQLVQSAVTRRRELSEIREVFRSEMSFTPFDANDNIDEPQIDQLIDQWLQAGDVHPEKIFGGGALLTGLTAQRQNASKLVQLIRRRLGDALIATADDPCLESWLAFMGSCAVLSRAHPEQQFLNLDIGGGTTNLALGVAGQVLRTGCAFVGARHIQVVPGTYQIVRLSSYAKAISERLKLNAGPGDVLPPAAVEKLVEYSVNLLETVVLGTADVLAEPTAQSHIQVPFRPIAEADRVAITFSGGVGELIYEHQRGKPWPATTHFGDLGIDLAKRIVASPKLSRSLNQWQPASGGRATVYGLLRHSTEVSGSTIYLPRPGLLPLTDLPILGTLNAANDPQQIDDLIELVARSSRGGCLQFDLGSQEAAVVREMGDRLAGAIAQGRLRPGQPFVLLVRENVGMTLGNYVTRWGTLPVDLIVIDEIAVRDAQYVQIGSPREEVVPVSFYGLNPSGVAS